MDITTHLESSRICGYDTWKYPILICPNIYSYTRNGETVELLCAQI